MRTLVICLLLGPAITAQQAFAQYATQWGSERSIEQISEHVFRWGGGGNFPMNGLFIPTSEGIVLIDGPVQPCEAGSSNWIKEELERRYDVPVRYVILSHDHQSHICGTAAFSDTAVVIGHKKITAHLIRERRVSAIPTVTFEDSLDIDLGGVKITLHHFGPTHSDNLIFIHIPEDGVLFAPDMSRPTGQLALPDFRDLDVDNTIEALGRLAGLENVDIVVPGHLSPVTDQSYFLDYRNYLRTLRKRVLDHLVAERSLDEIIGLVTMSDFEHYVNLEQFLERNIITMYDYLYRYREPNDGPTIPIRAPR